MIVYHGTTDQRAMKIRAEGFLPKPPSRRVWFAKGRGYSLTRARTQARRAHARPLVLTCEINLDRLRERLGPKNVFYSGGIVAINGPVPASVLRSHSPGAVPSTPDELAAWLNDLLGLKPYKGVSRRHPGIDRLSRWVTHHLTSQPGSQIRPGQLLQRAREWLPEFFDGVEIDPEDFVVYREVRSIEGEPEAAAPAADPREEEALDCLAAANPKRRIRGLMLLAELADPDLFDWCVMFLEDESTDVRVAALRTMLRCEEADAEVIVPLASSDDKRIRAAAIAALARHGGEEAPDWIEWGLKDTSACVRLEAATLLSQLDPVAHRPIFELALYDPNPQVARMARSCRAGKGYRKAAW